MFVHYRTRGFIIRKEDRGEADQLFTVYAREFGKLEVLAKAVRKINSKLRAGADIFYLSDLEFIQGKARKTLTDAVAINKFENLKKNLKSLKIAYQIIGALDNLIKGQEPDEQVWHLLAETFTKLNNWKIENSLVEIAQEAKAKKRFISSTEIGNWELEIFYRSFLWNLLSILGYKPDLYIKKNIYAHL